MVVIIAILAFFYAAEALALLFNNTATEKNQWWMGWLSRVMITGSIVVLMFTQNFRYLGVVMAVLAIYEIFQSGKNKKLGNPVFILCFLLFLLIIYGFLWFADKVSAPFQLYIFTLITVFDQSWRIISLFTGKNRNTISWQAFTGAYLALVLVNTILLKMIFMYVYWNPAGLVIPFFLLGGQVLATYSRSLMEIKTFSRMVPGEGGVPDLYTGFFAATLYFYIADFFTIPIL